jgi:hypothetical protein
LYFDNDDFLKSINLALTELINKIINLEEVTFYSLTSSNITFKIEPDNICKLILEVGSSDSKYSFTMLFDSLDNLKELESLANFFNS